MSTDTNGDSGNNSNPAGRKPGRPVCKPRGYKRIVNLPQPNAAWQRLVVDMEQCMRVVPKALPVKPYLTGLYADRYERAYSRTDPRFIDEIAEAGDQESLDCALLYDRGAGEVPLLVQLNHVEDVIVFWVSPVHTLAHSQTARRRRVSEEYWGRISPAGSSAGVGLIFDIFRVADEAGDEQVGTMTIVHDGARVQLELDLSPLGLAPRSLYRYSRRITASPEAIEGLPELTRVSPEARDAFAAVKRASHFPLSPAQLHYLARIFESPRFLGYLTEAAEIPDSNHSSRLIRLCESMDRFILANVQVATGNPEDEGLTAFALQTAAMNLPHTLDDETVSVYERLFTVIVKLRKTIVGPHIRLPTIKETLGIDPKSDSLTMKPSNFCRVALIFAFEGSIFNVGAISLQLMALLPEALTDSKEIQKTEDSLRALGSDLLDIALGVLQLGTEQSFKEARDRIWKEIPSGTEIYVGASAGGEFSLKVSGEEIELPGKPASVSCTFTRGIIYSQTPIRRSRIEGFFVAMGADASIESGPAAYSEGPGGIILHGDRTRARLWLDLGAKAKGQLKGGAGQRWGKGSKSAIKVGASFAIQFGYFVHVFTKEAEIPERPRLPYTPRLQKGGVVSGPRNFEFLTFFGSGSTVLTEAAILSLRWVGARELLPFSDPTAKILVVGKASSLDRKEFNQMLSKFRAQNVWEQMKSSLNSSGVPKLELVKVEGQGEAEAHLKDGDGVDNPKRRVVVLVLNSRVVLSAAESLL